MHKKYEILFCIYFQSFDFVVLLLWFLKRNSCTGKPPPARCIFRKPAALSGRQGVDFNWATTVKTRYGNTVCSINLGHTPVLCRLTYFFYTFTLYLSILQNLAHLSIYLILSHGFFSSLNEYNGDHHSGRAAGVSVKTFLSAPELWDDQWSGVILWHQPKQRTIIGEISGIYIPYSCIKFDSPPN